MVITDVACRKYIRVFLNTFSYWINLSYTTICKFVNLALLDYRQNIMRVGQITAV